MKNNKLSMDKRQKGQILVILALLFIGLIAVVGLATDLGMLYVSYSRLNRAVDAAALAASGEFKRNSTPADMEAAAEQFLLLNEVSDTNALNIDVQTCDNTPSDSQLCTTPRRKLVRIVVRQTVPMYFLSVIGIPSTPIEVQAISEAASLDVFLVLDNSTSMTETATRGPGLTARDPKICNASDPHGDSPTTSPYDKPATAGPDGLPGECHPFEEVKWATLSFIDQLDLGYDRMGIVAFNRMPHIGETVGATGYPGTPLIGNDIEHVDAVTNSLKDAVKGLTVYEGSGKCEWNTGDKYAKDPITGAYIYPADPDREMCRIFALANDTGVPYYWGMDCPNTNEGDVVTRSPGRCNTSNIGGGLAMAGNALAGEYGGYAPYLPFTPTVRRESVWVVILITDGNANAGYNPSDICPQPYWGRPPQCRDKDPYAYHTMGDPLYDPDDYARDMANIVAGNSVYMFSIGLGQKLNVRDDKTVAPWPCTADCSPGQVLLDYVANKAAENAAIANGDPDLKNFKGSFYNVGTNASDLQRVFLDIYNKLTTKLTQ